MDHELRKRGTSAADLKFLQQLQQTRLGTSNRKAALEAKTLLVPLCFRSSCQGVLRWITNFGSRALEGFPRCLPAPNTSITTTENEPMAMTMSGEVQLSANRDKV